MPAEGSVAPKERVNIIYKTSTGGAVAEKELPLKMLVVGDFTNRPDQTPIENRKPVNVNKDNFNEVLSAHKVRADIAVKNTLTGDGELSLSIGFKSIKDFEPEQVARQVPELSKLLDLREALNALRGPLGNIPAFRKKIQALIGDEATRAAILAELQKKKDA